MNDPVSILSFYFALIGFISGIFFTRLDSWYGEVRSKRAIVEKALKEATPRRETFINLEDTFVSLQSSAPISGFLAIGAFITALAILSIFIPVTNARFNPLLFLYGPVFVTVLAYWIGGGILLQKGRKLITQSLPIVESKITGKPLNGRSQQPVTTRPDPRIKSQSK